MKGRCSLFDINQNLCNYKNIPLIRRSIMKHFICSILSVLCVLLLFGCVGPKPYVYEPSKKIEQVNKIPLKLGIVPLKDERGMKNSDNILLCVLLPLVPYCESDLERPENSYGASSGFKASDDLAKAFVEEIKQNNIFKDVFFTQNENDINADIIMSGTIRTAKINQKITFYGLTVFGDLLWLLGLPAGNITTSLDLDYKINKLPDKAILWNYTFKDSKERTLGLYYGKPEGIFEDMQEILRKGLHAGVIKINDDFKTISVEANK